MDLLNPAKVFKQLDQNGDGTITEEDFVLGLEKLGLGKLSGSAGRMIFKQLDTNHNGKLDMDEALKAFKKVAHLASQEKSQKS